MVKTAPSQPRARVRARDVWVSRNVRTYHKGTATQSLLVGDVLGEIGYTDQQALKVLGITAWNVTPQGKNTQFIFLETEETMTLSGVRVEATDFGSASSLAGVKIHIPKPLSRTYIGGNLTTTILAKVSGQPFAAAADNEQWYCVEWNILLNATADQ